MHEKKIACFNKISTDLFVMFIEVSQTVIWQIYFLSSERVGSKVCDGSCACYNHYGRVTLKVNMPRSLQGTQTESGDQPVYSQKLIRKGECQ